MRASLFSRRGAVATVVLVATLLPASAHGRPAGARTPAACTNGACQCGMHEPGATCCCVEAYSTASGPSLAGGCGFRPDTDPSVPDTLRLAVLPPVLTTPCPLPSGLLARGEPGSPVPRGGLPSDPVPRAGS